MRKQIFNTLDVIFQIDYSYFIISQIADDENMSNKERRKYSMQHLRSIIRNKEKLGYDTSIDLEAHAKIKKLKL